MFLYFLGVSAYGWAFGFSIMKKCALNTEQNLFNSGQFLFSVEILLFSINFYARQRLIFKLALVLKVKNIKISITEYEATSITNIKIIGSAILTIITETEDLRYSIGACPYGT